MSEKGGTRAFISSKPYSIRCWAYWGLNNKHNWKSNEKKRCILIVWGAFVGVHGNVHGIAHQKVFLHRSHPWCTAGVGVGRGRSASIWLIWSLFWFIYSHKVIKLIRLLFPICYVSSLNVALLFFLWVTRIYQSLPILPDWGQRVFPMPLTVKIFAVLSYVEVDSLLFASSQNLYK